MSGATTRRGGGRWALALSIMLTGCRVGTDLPADDPVTLEPAEAVGVATAVLATTLENTVYSADFAAFTHQHSGMAAHTHPISGPYVHELEFIDGPQRSHHNLFSFDLTFEADCGSGGSVLIEAVVTGEGNPQIQPGSVHYVTIQTHQKCSVSLPAVGGAEFVLEAAPYLTVEAHATNNGAEAGVYGSLVGSVAWQAEAKGGTCEVDLQYTAVAPTMATVTEVALTGTFCGIEVDTMVPFSL